MFRVYISQHRSDPPGASGKDFKTPKQRTWIGLIEFAISLGGATPGVVRKNPQTDKVGTREAVRSRTLLTGYTIFCRTY